MTTDTPERLAQSVPKLTADKCWCTFTNMPSLHDMLVGIEDMTIPFAAEVVAMIIGDDDLGVGNEYFTDPHDFERFVNEHNWNDAPGMAQMAQSVSWAAQQALQGRYSEGKKRTLGALEAVAATP